MVEKEHEGVPPKIMVGYLMRTYTLFGILFLCFSLLAGEPYCTRIMSNFEDKEQKKVFTGHGLCFPVKIHGKKLIITALHLTCSGEKEANDILVDFPEGWIRCKIIKKEPKHDLCLLKPSIDPPFTIEVYDKDPKENQEVINPNYFAEMKMQIKDGHIRERFGPLWTGEIEGFGHGSSGSPLIDKKTKKVVAIAIAGFSKDGGETMIRALTVGCTEIKEFLEKEK